MKSKNPAQFFHYETYAMDKPPAKTGGLKKVTKGGGSKNQHEKSNVEGVCGEAQRLDDFSTHVDHVDEPILLAGVSPQAVFKMINGWMKDPDLKKSNGRRASRKESVLVAGVISYPHELGVDALDDAEFLAWQADVQEFLAKRYGESLQSVVCHLDERFPHCHYFAVNKPVENVWNPIEGLSCTHDIEKKLCDENGGRVWRKANGRTVLEAQTSALKALQTDFFNEVSQKYSHKRDIGARKKRLKLSPAVARMVSASMEKANQLIEEAIAEKSKIEQQKEMLNKGAKILKKNLEGLLVEKETVKAKATEVEQLFKDLEKVLTDAYKRQDLETIKTLKPKIADMRSRYEQTKTKVVSLRM